MFNKIKEIIRHRELLANLVIRDLKVKYRNSILGYLWSLLDPLLTVLLFVLVFHFIVRIKVENYPLFLITAILPWGFFHSSLNGAVVSISQNANLIKKVYFPREIFPISVILSNLINFLFGMLVFIPFIFFFKIKLSPSILFLPLVILIHIFFISGLALLVAHLNVFFNDIAFILKFVLNFWFYASPIFYPIEMVPDKFLNIYMLNPMASIIYAYRWVFIHSKLPDAKYLIMTACISFGTLLFGILFFKRRENIMIKRL